MDILLNTSKFTKVWNVVQVMCLEVVQSLSGEMS